MATIALLHLPFQGHLRPATRVGRVLVQAGHRVIAWSAEGDRATVEASGAEFRSNGPFVLGPGPVPPGAAIAAWAAEEAAARAEPVAQELLDAGVELLLHDQQLAYARVAGTLLGLPRITLHPIHPSVRGVDTLLKPPRGRPASDGIEAARQTVLRRWGVDLLADGGVLGNYGDRVLLLSAPPLVDVTALPASWRAVGPLLGDQPGAAPAGAGPPVVYVAFGTVHNDARAIAAVLTTLGGLPVRVIASLGGWGRLQDLGPPPANATVFEYVDPWHVLASASVHVTHAGAGSVQESLVAGVPMVCVPRGSDQAMWAQSVAATGAGVVLADLEPAALTDAVRRVLADRGFADRARAVGDALRAVDGPGIVRATVDELLPG